MPNIDKPQTKKKANANRVGSTLSKERDQPSSDEEGGLGSPTRPERRGVCDRPALLPPDHPSSGGTTTNEGVGGRDGGSMYPNHLSRCKGRGSHRPSSSLSSASRSGSPVTPGSASGRERSPIKHP